jgi:hypothetical protein
MESAPVPTIRAHAFIAARGRLFIRKAASGRSGGIGHLPIPTQCWAIRSPPDWTTRMPTAPASGPMVASVHDMYLLQVKDA